MGMNVNAVGGIGIVFAEADVETEEDEQFDGFWPGKGLICHEVGAYLDERMYFLGVGSKVDWNEGVDGKPVKLPDAEAVRTMIVDFLAAEGMPKLFKAKNFGFHVYPYVS